MVLRKNKQTKSRRYPAKTITDLDYTDDLALLANTPTLAEFLLPCPQQAAVGIGLHVTSNKLEYMCFKQKGVFSSLKLVDEFIYFGSNISSTESVVNIRQANAWSVINRLSII